jgi:hypothetical protein
VHEDSGKHLLKAGFEGVFAALGHETMLNFS